MALGPRPGGTAAVGEEGEWRRAAWGVDSLPRFEGWRPVEAALRWRVAVVEVKGDVGGPFIGEMRRWSGGGRWGGRRAVRGGVNGAQRRGAERRERRGAHW